MSTCQEICQEIYQEAFNDELQKIGGINEDVRDPRLYSNLRGMATLESKKKRIKAHEDLGKGKGTIASAIATGLLRKKK